MGSDRGRSAATPAFLPSTSYPRRDYHPLWHCTDDVDLSRGIATNLARRGQSVWAQYYRERVRALLGRPGRYARKTNRCSRHFDPRQTGVRRRRSPSAAHAPRERSGTRHGTWAEVQPMVVVDTAGGIDPPDSHRPARVVGSSPGSRNAPWCTVVPSSWFAAPPFVWTTASLPLSAYSSPLLDFLSLCSKEAGMF